MEFMVRLIDPFNVFPLSVLILIFVVKMIIWMNVAIYGMGLNMRVPEFVEGKFMGILMYLTFIFEIC